jgi:hypothetical protein
MWIERLLLGALGLVSVPPALAADAAANASQLPKSW